MNSKLRRISGDIFSHNLHDSLNLDGLILQVCYGFNPIDAAWDEYRRNVNPRIDADTMVFAYNSPHMRVPTREQFPMIISAELDQMAARGCRRIATNPLWFVDSADDRMRKGGREADRMMDDAINAWLDSGDNASRVDVIYVVDKYAKGVPSWKEAAMCLEPVSFTDYLRKGFRKDVSAWFDTYVDRRSLLCPSIAVVTSDGEGIKGTGPAPLRFKVASMYASVIIAAARAVAGGEGFHAVSRILGFPLVDRFMAGYVSPMAALEVSGLLPTDGEKDLFFDLVHVTADAVEDRVRLICESATPTSAVWDCIWRSVAPEIRIILKEARSYIAWMECRLKGDPSDCPGDPFQASLAKEDRA